MTGRNPLRNGAWATCWGRSILRESETTMANVFQAAGYQTAMFGKWHLGDNYPYRPQDRGFNHVVSHKGGGVGQTPDFWGNNYFNDTYFNDGEPVVHNGYCTDVWFEEAIRFIEKCTNGLSSEESEGHSNDPFFVYLATNAPHSPYLVSEEYAKPYRKNPNVPEPEFSGMIANIDANFGRLRRKLAELELEQNTILVFMTDNGSSGGCELDDKHHFVRGYNAGMRGKKGSLYDGGHRVPFLLRWPNGGYDNGREVNEMIHHIDVLPTFAELCDLDVAELVFDGQSVVQLLQGNQSRLTNDRIQFLQYRQNTSPPEKWDNVVMTRQWRLVAGEELYDIKADPGQRSNLAKNHPEKVNQLRSAHEMWWEEIAKGLEEYSPIVLGHKSENPTRLCAMDVLGDVAWHQTHISEAKRSTGTWSVRFEQPGYYRFSLRRWPAELGLPIDGAIPAEDAQNLVYAPEKANSVEIRPVSGQLKLYDIDLYHPVNRGDTSTNFTLDITCTHTTILSASFIDLVGERQGAYYVDVERLGKN